MVTPGHARPRVHALLHDVVGVLEPQARSKGLSLHVRVDPSVPFGVRGDPKLLRQVLLNLLGNAVAVLLVIAMLTTLAIRFGKNLHRLAKMEPRKELA